MTNEATMMMSGHSSIGRMTGMITDNRSRMTSMMTDDRSMMTSVSRGCIGSMTSMTTMSSEVVGTGSCNSRLVDGSNSTVRMRHQLRHVNSTMMTSMTMTNSSSMTNSCYCSVRSIPSMTGVTMSGQMVCTGGSHGRLVDWGDSAIGMRLKAVESVWRSRHTAHQCHNSKNQKLHFICAK